jgi:hypothetical protein
MAESSRYGEIPNKSDVDKLKLALDKLENYVYSEVRSVQPLLPCMYCHLPDRTSQWLLSGCVPLVA